MTNYDVIVWDIGSTASVSLIFGAPNTNQGGSEALNAFPITKTFIVKQVKVFVRVHTKGAIPMAIRDDGVSVLTWTIPAASTGLQYNSGPITLRIEAGSLLANMFDLATAGAGNYSYVMFAEGYWM
jgi:hypothetical protein